MRLAKLKTDTVFTAPCNTSILYPAAGGNMHCFTAKTSCAVLDVLGPPYSDPEGRHCTYYRDFPYTSLSGLLSVILFCIVYVLRPFVEKSARTLLHASMFVF